jgi:IS4 transposase
MTQDSLEAVQKEYDFRWKIEEFHREVKQVTGIEKCQCRIGRIQRNHIACAILVWNCLKKVANAASTTVYQVKSGLLRNYLIQELRNPIVCFA